MNAIKITLDKNASGKVAELYKDFAMYVNSYQNKLVDVYVPKEMLYTNPQNLKASETPTQFANSVKIGGILTADNGSKITTDSYYMDFLKETTINNVDYVVFERIMPKELTTYAGNQQIVINVLSVDSSVTPVKVLQVVTTQICNLLVQNSDYIGDETVVDPTKTEEFDARITQNKTDIVDLQTRMTTAESNITQNTNDIAQNTNDIAEIKQIIGTGEDYIGTLEWISATLPTDTELNAYVYEKRQREQKSGDVIIVIQKLAGQTDKNFKYIYALTGWTSYEIPPMELAGNGTAGIVSGTYGIGKTNDTLVDIAGGEILNIYIKDTAGQYRNLVEYLNTSNTTIANIISGATQVGNALKAVNDSVGNNIFETYLTKEFGVTKAELRDYAMPREFNDVDFISSQGYQDNVPTTPASGIQFTATSATAGDTQLFSIVKTNTADFELSAKNGYSNTIYVSADKDCQVQFRLTTQYKKASGDWQNLNIELSSSIGLIAGNIEKLTFANPFTYLEENVISLTNGDKIRQVLEVVTTTLETIVFDVYSNQTYPSIFNLTSQSYTLSEMTEVLVVPESAPAETELVAISPQNVQQLIELGNGLELVNGHIDVVLNSDIAPFVDYSKAQNLTDTQKAQARANIGAGSAVVSVESVNGKTGLVVLNASDVGAVATSDIVDNLTTEDATKVLSANQGKVLADMNAETNQQLALANSAITALQNSVATNTEDITQNTTDIASNTTEINGLKTNKANVDASNLSDDNVTNWRQKLIASTVSNPNLLINGDFRVNQRGKTSYVSDATIYTVDRWKTNILNKNISVTVTPQENGILLTYTSGSSGHSVLMQELETSDVLPLKGKILTLSYKITQITNSCRIRVMAGGNTILFTETISESGTFSKTFEFPETATGLNVRIISNSAENTVGIEYIKIELGSSATAFCPRPQAEELALCQRYYFKIINNTIFSGRGNSTNVCSFMIPLPVTQRVSGSISISNLIINASNTSYETNTVSIQSIENTSIGKNIIVATNLTTMAYRNAYNMYSTSAIELDAEIY